MDTFYLQKATRELSSRPSSLHNILVNGAKKQWNGYWQDLNVVFPVHNSNVPRFWLYAYIQVVCLWILHSYTDKLVAHDRDNCAVLFHCNSTSCIGTKWPKAVLFPFNFYIHLFLSGSLFLSYRTFSKAIRSSFLYIQYISKQSVSLIYMYSILLLHSFLISTWLKLFVYSPWLYPFVVYFMLLPFSYRKFYHPFYL